MTTRKSFTDEFKRDAVRLAKERGNTAADRLQPYAILSLCLASSVGYRLDFADTPNKTSPGTSAPCLQDRFVPPIPTGSGRLFLSIAAAVRSIAASEHTPEGHSLRGVLGGLQHQTQVLCQYREWPLLM
jgi:hypothetical protein